MNGFELNEEQRQLQEVARRFAENEIKPVAAAIDRIADLKAAYPLDVIRKGFELGFHALLIPEEFGGLGGSTLDYAVLLEELAAGDIGMANAFHVVMSISEMIARMGTKEQCQRWLVPIATDTTGTQLICFGANEPSGGSEIFCPHADPRLGTATISDRSIAERKGSSEDILCCFKLCKKHLKQADQTLTEIIGYAMKVSVEILNLTGCRLYSRRSQQWP